MTALATYLPYIQIILAILIIAAILMQQSDASSGGAFGGADNWNAGYHTRRGFEKIIFNITIVLGILFALLSLIAVIIK
jgi:preprotein translocase subunit SecG